MKRSILLATLVLLSLTGCFPLSLYPLYTDVKKDTVSMPEFVGCWKEINGNNTWKVIESPDGGTRYDLMWTDDKGKKGEFVAYVVDIKGKRFLDIVPTGGDGFEEMNGMAALHLVPTHTFWPLEIEGNHLTARYMNSEWLAKYMKEKPLLLRHSHLPDPTSGKTDDQSLILTAKPKKLQRFFLKHLSMPGAFTDGMEFERN